MSDPISRDEAVAAVLGTAIEYQLIYGKKEPKEGFVRSLIKRIANIPPQEEPSWIPVSEKYPTPWELVWVTDKRGHVNVCQMSHKGNQDWYDSEEEWMYKRDTVVAWMLLPKPYGEESWEEEDDCIA